LSSSRDGSSDDNGDFYSVTLAFRQTTGKKRMGVSETVALPVPVARSSARPPRNKRRLDMDSPAEHRSRLTRRRVDTVTAHKAQHLYRHKDITQSLQYTNSTTGQASLHGGGNGNYTD
jgi:hypothetical protein